MSVNNISPLACVTVFLMDEGLLTIISAGSYLLNRMTYLDQILHTHLFLHCLATVMQNGDEALPSIILACQSLLVNMLIHVALETHHIF